jgi:hypothetical protein
VNFFQWFSGFTDAEGCFSFAYRTPKTTACSFEFCIALHKDDWPLVRAVQTRLNMGNANIRDNKTIFIISSKDALLEFFNIFDKYPLNTSKQLNYLAFKQAYGIYHKCRLDSQKDGVDSLDLLLKTNKELLDLRNTMNSKRVNYIMPEGHSINITPY